MAIAASEFARHFGPAAMRREMRARYGRCGAGAEPRRVRRGEPLWRALDDGCIGAALAAAWAAVAEPAPGGEPPVELVCAVWRREGRSPIVAWGAACVEWSTGRVPRQSVRSGWIGRPVTSPLIVGRATGPAVWTDGRPRRHDGCYLPGRKEIYTTNDVPTCGACACLRYGANIRAESLRPFKRSLCAAGCPEYPLQWHAPAGSLGVPCRADFVRQPRYLYADAGGLRYRAGRALPPARLSAGLARYRDAPRRAAAAAALGRRGEAAASYVCR